MRFTLCIQLFRTDSANLSGFTCQRARLGGDLSMTYQTPSIQTTVVGSYPVPEWLQQNPSTQALTDATRVVINTQEQAGVDVVCDGELYRFDPNHPQTNGMIEYFVRPLAGIRTDISFAELMDYRQHADTRFRNTPPGVIYHDIDHGSLDLPSACNRAKQLATRPLKFTLTGPHMLAKTLINQRYGDTSDVAMALARVLAEQVKSLNADIIQIDEANLPGSPEEATWAAAAINVVLDAVPSIPAVHLCFGNYGGQSIQKGDWSSLLDYLNALHVDHIVMECAHRPITDLEALREVREDIGLGIGVIDIKRTEVESADEIAKAIDHAAHILGPDRLRYVHPDCGFWMLDRSIADAKMRSLVAGRDTYLGSNSTI